MQIHRQTRTGVAVLRSRRFASPRATSSVWLLQHLRATLALLLSAAAVLLIAVGLGIWRGNTQAVDAPSAAFHAFDGRPAGERAVDEAQQRLTRSPGDSQAMVRLVAAYLLRVRETGDPTYYAKADALLTAALAKNPADFDAMVVASSLAAARHEFGEALSWATEAVAAAPTRPVAYGALTDALVELGRYEEAVDAAQTMVDLRPDQASYARISYLRELHGDTNGAISAMRQAISAGAPSSEATAWSEYQLANLLFAVGDLDGAEQAYVSAGLRQPSYVYSVAGRARVRAARGDLIGSAALYEQAVSQMPLPEFAASLGDVYERMGQVDQAARQHELVVAFQRLQAANGVNVDVDLALYNADHGVDLERALQAARLEYSRRPSIHVADILAWIEYQIGDLDAANEHSAVAMHLGSRDPLMLYRAGVIAQAVGDDEKGRTLLGESHELNSQFSIRWAADLAQRVAALADKGGQG